MNRIVVHPNRRFLQCEDGAPFFYLGDTAWELFHRLTVEEADFYLRRRADQGFTVIQAVVLAEIDGLSVPNPNGDLPLHDLDPSRPNEPYFAHVDGIVRRANELGLVIAMLPTWADKVNRMWGGGPEIFDEANARLYGQFLGDRYRDADLIWVLGGNREVENERVRRIWRAMAEGLGNEHLRTFHPMGNHSSAEWVHDEPWLDFNMIQSGHGGRNLPNHEMIAADYSRTPVKPCMEAESAYEDHPVNWNPEKEGWFSEIEVRRPAYASVFAGGHGVTYGCHDVWQMWQPGRTPIAWARTPWREALGLPVASQMGHLKELMLSRPFFSRVPLPGSLFTTGDESYSLTYFPGGVSAGVDSEGKRTALWFDPRTGDSRPTEIVDEFTPPDENDWVLILDR